MSIDGGLLRRKFANGELERGPRGRRKLQNQGRSLESEAHALAQIRTAMDAREVQRRLMDAIRDDVDPGLVRKRHLIGAGRSDRGEGQYRAHRLVGLGLCLGRQREADLARWLKSDGEGAFLELRHGGTRLKLGWVCRKPGAL